MRSKGYYSIRTGRNPGAARLDLPSLKRRFCIIYDDFSTRGYFQEAFGYGCVDAGEVPGTLGVDIAGRMLLALGKEGLWPFNDRVNQYQEDDLFDVIEFLFDYVSKPIDGFYHTFNDCGMHYSTFNRRDGQEEFRMACNTILALYEDGYVLSDSGEILHLSDKGLSLLTDADLPKHDPANVDARVEAAIIRFRRYHSSLEDRKYALRELADILEYLRPKMKNVISSKDDSDLFQIINNFGVRHHNTKQKTNYNTAIWYSWMFYYFLATIHVCVRLIGGNEERPGSERKN
jgi:hypothetical protein